LHREVIIHLPVKITGEGEVETQKAAPNSDAAGDQPESGKANEAET
jgi:hypothetical protein